MVCIFILTYIFRFLIYPCISCLRLDLGKHKLCFVQIISVGNNGGSSSVIYCLTFLGGIQFLASVNSYYTEILTSFGEDYTK